jgi:hypothetical protein
MNLDATIYIQQFNVQGLYGLAPQYLFAYPLFVCIRGMFGMGGETVFRVFYWCFLRLRFASNCILA